MTRPCPCPNYDFWPTRIKPPPGACGTQAHVFCSADRFTYAEGCGYILPDAPTATCLDQLESPVFARGLIMHGSPDYSENGASSDGIATAPEWLRGVVPDIDEAGLAQLDDVGICGIRLSAMLKGKVGSDQLCGFRA